MDTKELNFRKYRYIYQTGGVDLREVEVSLAQLTEQQALDLYLKGAEICVSSAPLPEPSDSPEENKKNMETMCGGCTLLRKNPHPESELRYTYKEIFEKDKEAFLSWYKEIHFFVNKTEIERI